MNCPPAGEREKVHIWFYGDTGDAMPGSSAGHPVESLHFLLLEDIHTLHPLAEIILKSAGILSPPFTSTRSPTATPSALMLSFSPFRITKACCKKK